MRWAALLLVFPAALGGYFVAHKLRVYADRLGTPAFERSRDTERTVRAFESGRSAVSDAATGDAARDPWRQFVRIANHDDATLQAFFQTHAGTPVGARAYLQWVKRADIPSELATRRAAFATAYPTSWILTAWGASQ